MGQGDKGILSMGVNYPGLHIGTPFPSPLADLTSASSTHTHSFLLSSV